MKLKYVIVVLMVMATVLTIAFTSADATVIPRVDPRSYPPLMFDENGEFTILHLTDFHEYMLVEGATVADLMPMDTLKPRLTEFIDSCLNEVEPDLVVLGGDNIFGLSAIAEMTDPPVSILTYRAIAEFFEARGQYWTLTFGNHDSESLLDKIDFMNEVIKYDYFIGGTDDENYFSAEIFPSDTICRISSGSFRSLR